MKKMYFLVLALAFAFVANAQTVIYSNDFESGTVGTGATVVGSGAVEDNTTAGFGKVFHNAVGGQAIRTNYLQLPSTIFADLQTAATNELTISFWVNAGTATEYFYTPLFSAYGAAPVDGANTFPVTIFQSRLLAQTNVAGWCDFVPAANSKAVTVVNAENVEVLANVEQTDWLADAQWHFYSAVWTTTKLSIYVDGVVMNEWSYDGTCADGACISGIFTNGSELNYICLGGNQAWNWGDVDAAYLFDDVKIYSSALTKEQIDAVIAAKPTATTATSIFDAKTIGLKVYPNPVVNELRISANEAIESVELFNVAGQLVKTWNTMSDSYSVSEFQKGFYFVKVKTQNGTATQKVNIQ